jgi:hypothetical protein
MLTTFTGSNLVAGVSRFVFELCHLWNFLLVKMVLSEASFQLFSFILVFCPLPSALPCLPQHYRVQFSMPTHMGLNPRSDSYQFAIWDCFPSYEMES